MGNEFIQEKFFSQMFQHNRGWGSHNENEKAYFDRYSENSKKENMMKIIQAKLETAWHEIGTEVNLWDYGKLISI